VLVTEEWSDAEIKTFTRRQSTFMKFGLTDMDAERLAQTMLERDRPDSGDDRRLCLECRRIKRGVCQRGMAVLPTVLQRCDGFSMKGTV